MTLKPRILFVSEAVSLAHVARICALGGALSSELYDIHFASSGQFSFCSDCLSWTKHRLDGISPALFMKRLSRGVPVYSISELERYVSDDLKLIAAVQPNLIVNDFRLSLGVSARHSGIQLWSICNAHWSPYSPRNRLPAPDLFIAKILGFHLFGGVFNAIWPFVSKFHVKSANRLRRRFNLAEYRSLEEFYCDGDSVLYADTPSLVPIPSLPAGHMFLGPIVWSPPETVWPDWWGEVENSSLPLVYVTLGTTGNVDLLPDVIKACREERVRCLVATAGRVGFRSLPPWVYSAAFLPGSEAAAKSSLVVCNGGSATAHQALAQGKPVLGICSNLDQLLTMQSIDRKMAGRFFRASEFSVNRFRRELREMLSEPTYSEAALGLQLESRNFDARIRFAEAVAYALLA